MGLGHPGFVRVEDYLSTVYRPDVDYVEGLLEERNMGEKDHGKLQFRIASLMMKLPGVFAFIETKIQISATRFRVPDVCVYLDAEPDEQVFTTTPALCVEILSPEDRMVRTLGVVQDYLAMGVPQVWVLDPWTRRAYVADGIGLREVTRQIGRDRLILDVASIFAR